MGFKHPRGNCQLKTKVLFYTLQLVAPEHEVSLVNIESQHLSCSGLHELLILCGLAIYMKKYFYGKRRIMETQIFHHAKIHLIS
jgi:hypothetical protein